MDSVVSSFRRNTATTIFQEKSNRALKPPQGKYTGCSRPERAQLHSAVESPPGVECSRLLHKVQTHVLCSKWRPACNLHSRPHNQQPSACQASLAAPAFLSQTKNHAIMPRSIAVWWQGKCLTLPYCFHMDLAAIGASIFAAPVRKASWASDVGICCSTWRLQNTSHKSSFNSCALPCLGFTHMVKGRGHTWIWALEAFLGRLSCSRVKSVFYEEPGMIKRWI